MICYKRHKFRIYPTRKQQDFLNKSFGCGRFIYNFFLQRKIDEYKNGNHKYGRNECSRELTQLKQKEEFKWLREVPKQVLQIAVSNLDNAYKRFFKKISGFPKFKSRKSKQSIQTFSEFKIKGNRLYFPKMRDGIKITISREIEGKIKNATIVKTKTNKYFTYLCCEVDQKPLEKLTTKIGLDFGIKTLTTDSQGKKIENPRYLRKFDKKLKYLHRQFSKKKSGSNNWNKTRLKLAGVYEKIADTKEDFLNKISRKYINENQVICIEDLSCLTMLADDKNINKAVYDASLGKLERQLEYKSNWYGRDLIKVDKYFPSSQLCNSCNYRNKELKLSERTWKCPSCLTEHDRDINAAKNILKEGLRIMSVSRTDMDNKQKQVEPSICGLEKSDHQEIEAVKPENKRLGGIAPLTFVGPNYAAAKQNEK